LKPREPALDQARAFPDVSVMVMMVLLNVEEIWQIPFWTFFLTFRLEDCFDFFPFAISIYL